MYDYPKWFANTLLVATISSLLGTVLVILTAYVISSFQFKGRKSLMKGALILGMFPSFMGMVAVYLLMTQFNFINSHIGLALIYAGGAPMGYLVQKAFRHYSEFDLRSGKNRRSKQCEDIFQRNSSAVKTDFGIYAFDAICVAVERFYPSETSAQRQKHVDGGGRAYVSSGNRIRKIFGRRGVYRRPDCNLVFLLD